MFFEFSILYVQGRVTDHRINATKHALEAFLTGGDELHELMGELNAFHSLAALQDLYGLDK
jgi:protein subunit release factor A